MPKISPEALFRFLIVSQVRARVTRGERQPDVVADVAAQQHHSAVDGTMRRVSERSIYRWLERKEKRGLAGLEPSPRTPPETISTVLSDAFIKLLCDEKKADASTSIPEIISRARGRGILKPQNCIDRTTVYRTAKKLGLPVGRCRVAADQDTRRFAFPHRLDAVLCDGKHFRAGPTRARRVVLYFLDDATRFPLHAVVGTSESALLFLRGFYEMILKYGLMGIIYLDRGPGFIAADTISVVASLDIVLIHGKKAYPQGHGKIERFNQTTLKDLLRGLSGRPDVDPDLGALELRIRHYLEKQYSHRPHESLEKQTPFKRFHNDEKCLRFPEGREALRGKFEVTFTRRVSGDHIVSVDSVLYEMPRGYRGQKVWLRRKLLDKGGIFFLHQGRLIELHPVDLAANARAKRAQGSAHAEEEADPPPRPSAADLAFQRDYGPVVDADGGYTDSNPQEES